MAANKPARRLIVNADDFGRSRSINEAVIRAHREGILTSASLMVNEPSCEEAVCLARQNPKLGIGLHLALVCGKSALAQNQIPDLADADGNFSNNPVTAGCHYFFSGRAREQLRAEIEAQFERFHSTGLVLDHVNGHLNIHLHPAVFSILIENAQKWGIKHVRLTNDWFCLNARIASGEWMYRMSHAVIYRLLSARSRGALDKYGIRHTKVVFGLLQNARVNEEYILKLIPRLPKGDSELYSHPSLDEFKHEFDALLSPRVVEMVRKSEVELIRYQDL